MKKNHWLTEPQGGILTIQMNDWLTDWFVTRNWLIDLLLIYRCCCCCLPLKVVDISREVVYTTPDPQQRPTIALIY